MYKSGIILTLIVAMVKKLAAKIGGKWEIDHFGANLRRLTEKGARAIRRIFSLVDIITKSKFSN